MTLQLDLIPVAGGRIVLRAPKHGEEGTPRRPLEWTDGPPGLSGARRVSRAAFQWKADPRQADAVTVRSNQSHPQ